MFAVGRGAWVRIIGFVLLGAVPSAADESADLAASYEGSTYPLIRRYCLQCHSSRMQTAEVDLERFTAIGRVQKDLPTWLKVEEMLDNGQMPPPTSLQPTSDERKQLLAWIERFKKTETLRNAGDPGRVILRRLSNAEYDVTIRDLTGVDLRPTRTFPVDGAAGEGFTNTGDSLVMSPSLLDKYMDAASRVASHAMLLPGGLRFSKHNTRRDWSDEAAGKIKAFYSRYANEKGRFDLKPYLVATLHHRAALRQGEVSLAQVAQFEELNSNYLSTLWKTLEDRNLSDVLNRVRSRWLAATADSVDLLIAEIEVWRRLLWKFNTVGHTGRWQTPSEDVILTSQTLRAQLKPEALREEVVVYLVADETPDGNQGDWVLWSRPRLEAKDQTPVLLRDLDAVRAGFDAELHETFAKTSSYLAATAEMIRSRGSARPAELARKHAVEEDVLRRWITYLGVKDGRHWLINGYLQHRMDKIRGYDFVNGWGVAGENYPYVAANASDQLVPIPGLADAHSVVLRPGLNTAVAAGWKSPIDGTVGIELEIGDAQIFCGNGVSWTLEFLAHQGLPVKLGSGEFGDGGESELLRVEPLPVRRQELISLVVDALGEEQCDLTRFKFTIVEIGGEGRRWNIATDVADSLVAGNPHTDSFGNPAIWHFYGRPVDPPPGDLPRIPPQSLLARWIAVASNPARQEELPGLTQAVHALLTGAVPEQGPDSLLVRQLDSIEGPLLEGTDLAGYADFETAPENSVVGLVGAAFGKHPLGLEVDAASLVSRAPAVVELRLPARLVTGRELVVDGMLDASSENSGSVQLRVLRQRPEERKGLLDRPVVVPEKGAGERRFRDAFRDFREVFPAALCYPGVVPLDEIVTLRPYYREDERLRRLFLDDREAAELERLWHELHYVSRDARELYQSFDVFMARFPPQSEKIVKFEPLREPIRKRAEAFDRELVETRPAHLEAAVDFAGRAYRRPLNQAERREILDLYHRLRQQEESHDTAIRSVLAAVLVSPKFLYKVERPGPSEQPQPVSNFELATRLSYFLWSSMPDDELRGVAAAGHLSSPEVLLEQASRMLLDPRSRGLAEQFAAQWLLVRDFDQSREKSEKFFPNFDQELRQAIGEETIRFFEDLIREDRSVLEIIGADHVFVNGRLSAHYGIPGIGGPEWRRIDGAAAYSRGGVLAMASVLAKQSGASRTSPVLRGNFIVEFLLGEKLPDPPADVPELPDRVANEELSVRELTEKHRSAPQCRSCHDRIDPYGFALEAFDPIGRFRETDTVGRAIDTRVELADGTRFEGLAGLRRHLLTQRREQFLGNLVKKLLGYALGRSVVLSDQPLIDRMLEELEAKDHRFSSLVAAIVRSKQFRFRRGLGSGKESRL